MNNIMDSFSSLNAAIYNINTHDYTVNGTYLFTLNPKTHIQPFIATVEQVFYDKIYINNAHFVKKDNNSFANFIPLSVTFNTIESAVPMPNGGGKKRSLKARKSKRRIRKSKRFRRR